jgi:hypothetical protein
MAEDANMKNKMIKHRASSRRGLNKIKKVRKCHYGVITITQPIQTLAH